MRCLFCCLFLVATPAYATFFLDGTKPIELPPVTEETVETMKLSSILETAIAYEICAQASWRSSYPSDAEKFRERTLQLLEQFSERFIKLGDGGQIPADIFDEYVSEAEMLPNANMMAGAIFLRVQTTAKQVIALQVASEKSFQLPYTVQRLLLLRDLPFVFNCNLLSERQ